MAPELSNLYTCPLQLFEHPNCRLHTLASDLKHSTPNRLPLFFFCSLCHSRRNKCDVYSQWSTVCVSGLCWTSTHLCHVQYHQGIEKKHAPTSTFHSFNARIRVLVYPWLIPNLWHVPVKNSSSSVQAQLPLVASLYPGFMLISYWLKSCSPGTCSTPISWKPVSQDHAHLPLVDSL